MEIVGIVAGLLTLFTYVPQSVKTLRTRSTADLSLSTLVLLATSALLWVVYGIWSHVPAVWVTNVVVSGLACAILAVKLREGGGDGEGVAAEAHRD